MTKFLLAGAAMFAISTAALADEPQKLTEGQLSVVAGGIVDNGNNGKDLPSTLSLLLLNIETTDVTSTQMNVAESRHSGAAVGFGGAAILSQMTEISQVNVN